jgi:hypothetical protein
MSLKFIILKQKKSSCSWSSKKILLKKVHGVGVLGERSKNGVNSCS